MKKLVYLFIASLLLTACITYKTLNLNRLTTGMTKAEVEYIAGSPYRVLAVNQARDGYQEVLEYRTLNNEYYALEFWDDYLTGYEYLDNEVTQVTYVPAPVPPAYYPAYGRPVVVVRPHPDHPSYRPSSRPGTPSPPSKPSQPSRPAKPSKPSSPSRSDKAPDSSVSIPRSNSSSSRSSSSSGSTSSDSSGSSKRSSGRTR